MNGINKMLHINYWVFESDFMASGFKGVVVYELF